MTLKLEVGKYYRTRDGGKVGPIEGKEPYVGTYIIEGYNESYGFAWFEDGRKNRDYESRSDLVAEWNDEPMDNHTEYKPWKDLTDIEKGALLLARHEGKEIEFYNPRGFRQWLTLEYANFKPSVAYRIKPEPVVENRNIYANCGDDRFIGTITYKDGKPDCNSIKMEEL